MDFCAMRLYSNFKQAQENMERHAILDSIDVMPEIYDILRHCEESHLTADEKSLLATQLAPHWTNSEEARSALETAVVYTEAEEEAEFWQGLQVCSVCLSIFASIVLVTTCCFWLCLFLFKTFQVVLLQCTFCSGLLLCILLFLAVLCLCKVALKKRELHAFGELTICKNRYRFLFYRFPSTAYLHFLRRSAVLYRFLLRVIRPRRTHFHVTIRSSLRRESF